VLANGQHPDDLNEVLQNGIASGIVHSVPILTVDVHWIFHYLDGFSDDVGMIFMDVCCNFCRMFGYC
jgi:hypothetical protein